MLLVEKSYIKFQVYLMAIYVQKKNLEKSIFYLLPQNSDFARFTTDFFDSRLFKSKRLWKRFQFVIVARKYFLSRP